MVVQLVMGVEGVLIAATAAAAAVCMAMVAPIRQQKQQHQHSFWLGVEKKKKKIGRGREGTFVSCSTTICLLGSHSEIDRRRGRGENGEKHIPGLEIFHLPCSVFKLLL